MTETSVEDPVFLTLSAAARQANVADETIRSWFDNGEIGGHRSAHGHRLIDPSTLQRRLACVGVTTAANLSGYSEQVIRGWFDHGLIDGYRNYRGWRRILLASLQERIDSEQRARDDVAS